MNLKWYFSTLLITVALFFGVASQQQSTVPNQEIVLQLSGNVALQDNAQRAISLVKQQLQNIGAENIQVSEDEDGVLKITYYCDSDIDSIKKILSEDEALAFKNSTSQQKESPSEEHNPTYNFDVFEIHNGFDMAFHHAGKVAVELKASSHHFSQLNDGHGIVYTTDFIDVPSIKVAYKFYKDIALAIDNTSKKIPEVRAGPFV
ncbi:conserved hypothetical protein [Formosa agariphila KMM 3901]|uniref:HMA domain-containing protein n=1 Tax=Formosa agariphila (strain DSM 15362 / KCTC 12365 / LMG 23005 / KMM 3901 / M-2Alg 35-1) TaxID=1347342 RepID=T2KIU3_FORAG|nr:hypothetical protein [Formosa agariphila]CDF78353.1 conserved hypothetical protein [Formosa agariphila KMM 3901]